MRKGNPLRTACLYAACTSALALSTAQTASGAIFPEVEPNDNKLGANPVGPMVAGDMITGTTTGSSTTVAGPASSDNFLVTVGGAPLGVYRHRLVLTSNTLGQTGTIRGLTQTAGAINPGTDAALQTSSSTTTPPRYNQWYGFGKGEMLYYRVTGLSTTTADYASTLDTTPVATPFIGTFSPGEIVIQTTGTTTPTSTTLEDTDLWVYDENLNAIPGYGNDDEPGGTGANTFSSRLTRDYAPGIYYLAITDFGLANNQSAAPDDDFQTGSVTDFPNIVLNSNSVINENLNFRVTDSLGTIVDVVANKDEPYEVKFFRFEVVPEPGSAMMLGTAALAMLMRQRRRA